MTSIDDDQPHSGIFRAHPSQPYVITMTRELATALDALLWQASFEREQLADDDPFTQAFEEVQMLHDCRRIKLGGATRWRSCSDCGMRHAPGDTERCIEGHGADPVVPPSAHETD